MPFVWLRFDEIPIGNKAKLLRFELAENRPKGLTRIQSEIAGKLFRKRHPPSDWPIGTRRGRGNIFDRQDRQAKRNKDRGEDFPPEHPSGKSFPQKEPTAEKNDRVANPLGRIHKRWVGKGDGKEEKDRAKGGPAAIRQVEDFTFRLNGLGGAANLTPERRNEEGEEGRRHAAEFHPNKAGNEIRLQKD